MQSINYIWLNGLKNIIKNGEISSPRGMKIKEIVGHSIKVPMKDPIITLTSRKMNFKFALGEAWWVTSGSNKVNDITQFMKRYKEYSDDGVFLNGAYGVKFIDQLRYIVDNLESDQDSRQAVLNIWRENPRQSKDIPCTLSHQYLIRDGELHCIANMRSHDMVWGFSYDTFTFSMMAKTIQTLLSKRNINVEMGTLTINQGSAHIYEKHWDEVDEWIKYLDKPEKDWEKDSFIWNDPKFSEYSTFTDYLKYYANNI